MIKKMLNGAAVSLDSFEKRMKFLGECKANGLYLSMVDKETMANAYGDNTCYIMEHNKVTPIHTSFVESRNLKIVRR